MDANIINGVLLNSVDYLNGVGSTSIATVNGVSWVSGPPPPPFYNSIAVTVYGGPGETLIKGTDDVVISGNTMSLNNYFLNDIYSMKITGKNDGYDLLLTNIEFYLSGWISTYFSNSYWTSPGNAFLWENPYQRWIKIDSGDGSLEPIGGWASGFWPTDVRFTFSYQISGPI